MQKLISCTNESIRDFIEKNIKEYLHSCGSSLPETGLYDIVIEEVERAIISTSLEYTNGVQAKAAILLGISRNTLRHKMVSLKI